MTRKYKILDNEGNPVAMTISFEDGTHFNMIEFTSIEAVGDIAATLRVHDMPCKIEVL